MTAAEVTTAVAGHGERPAGAVHVALTGIVGHESEPGIAERLHELRHRGAVDEVEVGEDDLPRRRLRLTGASGAAYAIALPRESILTDGAVLALTAERAVVVRARSAARLRLRAADPAAAMRLGFLAGHLHWICEMGDGVLEVVLQAPEQDYLDRIADLLGSGAVTRVHA